MNAIIVIIFIIIKRISETINFHAAISSLLPAYAIALESVSRSITNTYCTNKYTRVIHTHTQTHNDDDDDDDDNVGARVKQACCSSSLRLRLRFRFFVATRASVDVYVREYEYLYY